MRKEILLSYFPKITSRRYQQLVAVFDNLDNVWNANRDEIIKTGWKEDIVDQFFIWKEKLDENKIERIIEQEEIYCITKDDDNYPALLKEIYDPPFCLFVRGEFKPDDFSLAVVGTRKFSPYGKQVTGELVSELAHQGITIISGLAIGIDCLAHEATLKAGGKTIAVLGSGINKQHIYPGQNKDLAERIIKSGGALISEYPPGTLPSKFTFPRRNRIVAGMSLGTLVIEAPEGSGALITAQCSLDNDREVFSVPQNINSANSSGPNELIKNGAQLVTKASDILDALNLQDVKKYISNQAIIPDSPVEAKILDNLTREPIHIDELTKKCELDSSSTNATLILMEMKGKVRNLGGMMYVLGR
ncbi:MAG TPA: DNA-protecting protein DprA [Candidatus Magasanikbacteria bacterium]|nr:DNA-protecting protein DprA [Candidatus Magasanikbacteria bacterium]